MSPTTLPGTRTPPLRLSNDVVVLEVLRPQQDAPPFSDVLLGRRLVVQERDDDVAVEDAAPFMLSPLTRRAKHSLLRVSMSSTAITPSVFSRARISLPDPVPKSLRRACDLLRDRTDRGPLRGALLLVVWHRVSSHCSSGGPNLGREGVRAAAHCSPV